MEMHSRNKLIRIPSDLEGRVLELAQSSGESFSTVVRMLLREGVARREANGVPASLLGNQESRRITV